MLYCMQHEGDASRVMFTNRDLRKLIIPLIVEQVLMALMGAVDTVMVTSVGAAAISGVSLVDSINALVVDLLTALATGGAIICSQYLGRGDREHSSRAAQQVILASFTASLLIMAFCLATRSWLLRVIFGTVEPEVMENALIYFFITALSYPFVALFGAGSALYRSGGNSRISMIISVSTNILNIVGNAILIFAFNMGAAGAALSTLVSRIIAAVVILICLRRRDQVVEIGSYLRIRPDFHIIWLVLCVGLPTGIESGMFQFGKLVVQSTVSTLGTTAIAANAILAVMELFSSKPSMGIGFALMTVAGQCMGAGRPDEARYYIKKLTLWSAAVLLVTNWLIYFITPTVMRVSGLDPDAAKMAMQVLLVISIVKPIIWPMAFTPSNGTRAAGDARFNMIATSCTMWIFRVGLTTVLCRFMGVGLIGIWAGYMVDWLMRAAIFALRLRTEKWHSHHLIEDIE